MDLDIHNSSITRIWCNDTWSCGQSVISMDLVTEFDLGCHGPRSCNHAVESINEADKVDVECGISTNSCRNIDWVVSKVGVMNVRCDRNSACFGNSRLLSEVGEFELICDGRFSCDENEIVADFVESFSLECVGQEACLQNEWTMRNSTAVMIDCQSSSTLDNTCRLSIMEAEQLGSLVLGCEGDTSCFSQAWTFVNISEVRLSCSNEFGSSGDGSCAQHSLFANHVRSFTLNCEDRYSCYLSSNQITNATEVQINCNGVVSCYDASIEADGIDSSLTVLCQASDSCYRSDRTVNNVGSFRLDCRVYYSCIYGQTMATNITNMTLECEGSDSCYNQPWDISHISRLDIHCSGFYSCYRTWSNTAPDAQTFRDVQDLNVRCVDPLSCYDWWYFQPWNWAEITQATIYCGTSDSCRRMSRTTVYSDPLTSSNIVARQQGSHFSMICGDETACVFREASDLPFQLQGFDLTCQSEDCFDWSIFGFFKSMIAKETPELGLICNTEDSCRSGFRNDTITFRLRPESTMVSKCVNKANCPSQFRFELVCLNKTNSDGIGSEEGCAGAELSIPSDINEVVQLFQTDINRTADGADIMVFQVTLVNGSLVDKDAVFGCNHMNFDEGEEEEGNDDNDDGEYEECGLGGLTIASDASGVVRCSNSNCTSVSFGPNFYKHVTSEPLELHCSEQSPCSDTTVTLSHFANFSLDCRNPQFCSNMLIQDLKPKPTEIVEVSISPRFNSLILNDERDFVLFLEEVVPLEDENNDESSTLVLLSFAAAASEIQEQGLLINILSDSASQFDSMFSQSSKSQSRNIKVELTASLIEDYSLSSMTYFNCIREGSCKGPDFRVIGAMNVSVQSFDQTVLLGVSAREEGNNRNNIIVDLECADDYCSHRKIFSNDSNIETEMTVWCLTDGSCDRIVISGYCAESVRIEMEEGDQRDAVIICPQSSSSDTCKVIVRNNAQMNGGRIGMSARDLDQSNYRFAGDSDAFKDVATIHVDEVDEQCDTSKYEDKSVDCFLTGGNSNLWFEGSICFDFVMSLYSPTAIVVISATCAFGSAFTMAAFFQVTDFRMEEDPMKKWIYSKLMISFFLTSMSALIGGFFLLSYETEFRQTIGTSEHARISPAFGLFAAGNLVLFCTFLSFCEFWMIFSDNGFGKLKLSSVTMNIRRLLLNKRHQRKSQRDAVWVVLAGLRMFEMLLVYIIVSGMNNSNNSDGNDGNGNDGVDFTNTFQMILLLFTFFITDVLILCCSSLSIVWFITLISWLMLSQFSPMAEILTAVGSKTYFQVLLENNNREYIFLWFDIVAIEMIFGFGSMMFCSGSISKMINVWFMFVQFLDFATDLTVIAFWLSSGFYLWASIEIFFLFITSLVQWSAVKEKLSHWKEHVMILLGFARGYTKIRLWYFDDPDWIHIDSTVTQLETFYESFTSVTLGIYLVCSDIWASQISGDAVTRASNTQNLGPLFISVIISSLSVASKTLQKTGSTVYGGQSGPQIKIDHWPLSQSKNKIVIRILAALFIFSDFIIRTLPIVFLFTLSQGGESNTRASDGLIICVFVTIPILVAWQWLVIGYASHDSISDSILLRNRVYLSLPSVFSVAAMFFQSFSSRRVRAVFKLNRVFWFHWLYFFLSLCLVLSIMTTAVIWGINMWPAFITYFVAMSVNFASGLFLHRYVAFKVL